MQHLQHMLRLSKKITVFILLISIAAAFTGCGLFASEGNENQGGMTRYDYYFDDCFNTGIQLIAYCDSEDSFAKMVEIAHNMFLEYHEACDIYYNYGSPNACSLNSEKSVTIEEGSRLAEVIEIAKGYYELTDGNTNVAMGSVLSLWHEVRTLANDEGNKETVNLPSYEALKEASLHCSQEDLVVDYEAGTISLKDELMTIDLGAVAKGYATNAVGQALIESGLSDAFMINSGGNCFCKGTKPDGSSWVIGVQDPDNLSGGYVEKLALSDVCVATSGDYYRYFEIDGVRYCHIIDPDTLYPANKYRSVTVISPDAGLCDALSTALFISDIDEGTEILKKAGNACAMWIMADGTKEYSEGFTDYVR